MFNNLRSSGHNIFVRLMLLFIVLTFCLWGIGDIFKAGLGDGSLAKVGKVPISTQEFQRVLRARQNELRERLKNAYTPDLAKRLGLEKMALDSIVNRIALELEAEAMGLVAGDDDVMDFIAHNPGFRDESGRFSKEVYLSVLDANGTTEKAFLQGIQRQLTTNLLISTITSDIGVPNVLAEAMYRAREERREAGLLVIPATAAAQAEPTQQELKAYYDAHADQFKVPEYRAFSYVEITPEAVQASVNISDAEIQKAYEARAEEFQSPERRALEQLVFDKMEDAEKAAQMLASGKSMADVAAALAVQNKDKLSLGELSKESIPVAASEVFALPEGGFSRPAQSPFGWHIFHVSKIIPAGKKPLADVKDVLMKDLSARAVQDAVYRLSNTFEDAVGGGASLEEAAQKIGQKVQSSPAVTREGGLENGPKATLPAYTSLLETVFSTAEKEHSRLVQADNGAYFMVRVDAVKPEHARPLAEVAQAVAEAVKHEQADKALQALAKEVADALKSGKKPEEAVAGKGVAAVFEPVGALLRTSDVAGEGRLKGRELPPDLVAELFRLKQGGYSQAYAMPGGGYAVARLDKVVPAPAPGAQGASAEAFKAVQADLQKNLPRQLEYEYLNYLRTKYPVTVNRAVSSAVLDDTGE